MSLSTESKQIQDLDLVQNKVSEENASIPNLPEKPIVVIEPSRGWIPINLSDLWNYRDLLYILTMRDIKVRYKQTVLGVAWAILQPLFTMIVFTIFFGRLAGVPSDGVPYPIFAFAGLLPWTFFSNAVNTSGNSLVGSANLITKVYFPRMVIPIASVAAGLLDLGISFGLLILMMFYYGVGLSMNLLMLPVITVLMSLLAIGVGMWMSALNVKYRDIRFLLPFLIQLGMFASAVIYPSSIIPEKYRWLMLLNPIAGFIEAFRAACFGHSFNWLHLGIATLMTFAMAFFAAYNFRKMERSFADLI